MPSNRLGECSIWHAFLHFEADSKPNQKIIKGPTGDNAARFPLMGSSEKIDISALKYPVSRDARTPVCILIVTGVAKANTLKYIWEKKKEQRSEELYVLLFKIFRGMCWGG